VYAEKTLFDATAAVFSPEYHHHANVQWRSIGYVSKLQVCTVEYMKWSFSTIIVVNYILRIPVIDAVRRKDLFHGIALTWKCYLNSDLRKLHLHSGTANGVFQLRGLNLFPSVSIELKRLLHASKCIINN
jgi:hypothetical protein